MPTLSTTPDLSLSLSLSLSLMQTSLVFDPKSYSERMQSMNSRNEVMKKRAVLDDDPSCCRVCNETFKSMKSLYGHMRCHQRNWRGVSPPPNAPHFTAPHQDLPPKNWSVTAKRGRKAGKSSTATSSHNDPIFTDAVTNLLLLANYQRSKADKSKKKKLEVGRHRCVTCSKTFSSYQALGGHRSSHKKVRGNDNTEEIFSVSGVVTEDRKARKLPGFDLNEPPKEEEDQ